MPFQRNRHKPPKRIAHPIIGELFRLQVEHRMTYEELDAKSGISKSTMQRWKDNGAANILNIAAVAEVFGYEIVLRRKE